HLTTDHPRPTRRTFQGASHSFACPAETCTGLRRLAQAHNATLFMTFVAAFQALLHRYSGHPLVRIGAPISGRDRVEIEPLIGVFVNTLVLTAEFGDDPTFVDLLARVRGRVLGALAHKDLPFERLVDAVGA